MATSLDTRKKKWKDRCEGRKEEGEKKKKEFYSVHVVLEAHGFKVQRNT